MVTGSRAGVALCAASLLGLTYAKAGYSATMFSEGVEGLERRQINETEYDACLAINALNKTSALSIVDFLGDIYESHYMTSSSQAATCVYLPQNVADLAAAIEVVGSKRINFAVACSGHASNQGFSSTTGVQISMNGFQNVTVSSDNTYVDIGGGIAWADVYTALDSSTVNVVGGRVPGPGIGGFITGGGGYSWLTNQYGLTGDTLISAEVVLPNATIVTASETENPDLFWAIKGGGNQFGVVSSFRLKAVARPSEVYAGSEIYLESETPAVLDAIYEFASTNTDPKAQIIPTLNYLEGIGGTILLAYYDGIPTTNPFSMFNVTFEPQSFNSFIQSIPSKLEGGQRGGFNTISVQEFSQGLLDQIANQSTYYGGIAADYSGTFISYDVEPFLPYSQYAQEAAWPHSGNGLPLNLYFAWTDSAYDTFWQDAMLESAALLQAVAEAEGQDLSGLYLYPNYALAQNPSVNLYGSTNLARLAEIKAEYDPTDIMGLTTYFPF